MDSVTKKLKDIRTLSYRIEHEGVSTAELLEKTFCFACGCFQGGGGSGGGGGGSGGGYPSTSPT